MVIPSYNEEAWIAETVSTIPEFVDHIILVDDASTDATSRVAHSLPDGRLEIVRHETNRGVGAAIATGYRTARARGAEAVAVMAGDGQMHPADLYRVVEPIVQQTHDYVKGNRLTHPDVYRSMPLARLAAGHVLGRLTGLAIGKPQLSDSQCGYTAISARAIDALDLDRLWPRYGYPNDLLGEIARRGLSIGEVPVRPVYRGEASGVRPWHVGTVMFLLARTVLRRANERRREHLERS
ncbi:MAG: glycosyltransferase family 2 protein [Polyangiaceae bacterium]|nr:glycosyltransferase family 2 protein [Polyangiaceae bacterium]